jgi:hypothetical protein
VEVEIRADDAAYDNAAVNPVLCNVRDAPHLGAEVQREGERVNAAAQRCHGFEVLVADAAGRKLRRQLLSLRQQ